jgi:hypothetical protein
MQTSREGSNSTKHERRPPEDGQTIVTEICRVLIDVFYKHFKQFGVLNVNVSVFYKECMSWFE